ncbi:MAG: anhydro-N-acetylmuramic acid kinase [bacterium]
MPIPPNPPLPPRIERLARLAGLAERRVLGLMSGTSLDGLDLALCTIGGQSPGTIGGQGPDTAWRLERFHTLPYSAEQRERLLAVVSQPRAGLRELAVLNAWLAGLHAAMVRDSLAAWDVDPASVHLLASHGVTVYHAPGAWEEQGTPRHATLQLGDGDQLAVATGLLTVSDFRQKEIALGGEGAPLAPYGDALLFTADAPRVLLNLGGIANFTRLASKSDPASPLSGDTGPANGLIDRAVRRLLPGHSHPYDHDGLLAAQGKVSAPLLESLLEHPYYARPFPKSTGAETFGDACLEDLLNRPEAKGLAPHHLIATLTRLTVRTVAEAMRRECGNLAGTEIAVSGGGRRNPVMMEGLRTEMPEASWIEMESLGLPPDAKEAVLFAVLAHESLFGEGFPQPGEGPEGRRFGFGKLSWPN